MKMLILPVVIFISMQVLAQSQDRLATKECSIAGTHVLNIGADGSGTIDNGTQDADRTMKVSLNGSSAEVTLNIISEVPTTSSDYDDGCYKGKIYAETLNVNVVTLSPRAQAFLKMQAGESLSLSCNGQDLSLPTADCKMTGR